MIIYKNWIWRTGVPKALLEGHNAFLELTSTIKFKSYLYMFLTYPEVILKNSHFLLFFFWFWSLKILKFLIFFCQYFTTKNPRAIWPGSYGPRCRCMILIIYKHFFSLRQLQGELENIFGVTKFISRRALLRRTLKRAILNRCTVVSCPGCDYVNPLWRK